MKTPMERDGGLRAERQSVTRKPDSATEVTGHMQV